MKSNCLFFAVKKFYKNGGYLAIRRSHFSRFIPHFIWVKDLKDAEIEHFQPEDPRTNFLMILIHKIYFKGTINKTDKESKE